DLDRFKDINDSLGHATGDRILRAAAARVQQTVGAQHTVARLSGDEFTVVLEDIASFEEAENIAEKIIDAFRLPLSFGERLELAVSPSIGISVYPDHAQVPTDLLKHADTAMYQAKAAGRHTYQVYSEAMDEKTRHRAILTNALRRALENSELSLVFQPRLSLAQQRITGAEALLRWKSREFGEVSPGQFIPLAEESGQILEIGAWALREACQTLRDWHEQGLTDLTVAVNVSALQLQRGDLSDVVAQVLSETGVPARCLELELTESVIMANPAKNADTLRACRALGVFIAIDDFGTGYSSLAYLKRLPLTTLKIDQEFVSDLTHDTDDEAITSTIINMGHSLSLNVIAEGVETAAQLQFLHDHGCDEIQGHWISHALAPQECLQFMREYGQTHSIKTTC
ncbi:MAG: bifunctional diguanylate cyclase/phosphodiesterase, partial [Pseudoxanthomonas sp.]